MKLFDQKQDIAKSLSKTEQKKLEILLHQDGFLRKIKTNLEYKTYFEKLGGKCKFDDTKCNNISKV